MLTPAWWQTVGKDPTQTSHTSVSSGWAHPPSALWGSKAQGFPRPASLTLGLAVPLAQGDGGGWCSGCNKGFEATSVRESGVQLAQDHVEQDGDGGGVSSFFLTNCCHSLKFESGLHFLL